MEAGGKLRGGSRASEGLVRYKTRGAWGLTLAVTPRHDGYQSQFPGGLFLRSGNEGAADAIDALGGALRPDRTQIDAHGRKNRHV